MVDPIHFVPRQSVASSSGTSLIVEGDLPPADKSGGKAKSKGKGPAKKIALVVMLVLAGLTSWNVMTDLMAPYSSRASVAASTALIAPRVPGQVIAVHVQDNQKVEQGEKLFELDPAPFDLAVRQAEANLAQAVLGVDASTASLPAIAAKVDQARSSLTNARAISERTTSLAQRGLATRAAADKAAADLAIAEDTLLAAEAELTSAKLKLGGEDNPAVEAAQAQLEQAQLNRAFSVITAPEDGYITNLKLTPGQFINAGAGAMTFIAGEQLWVMADLRENQLTNVRPGDEVGIVFDARAGAVLQGRVHSIAWGIDTGRTSANGLKQNQPSTRWFEPARTIPLRIDLDAGQWPENIRVGSKASAVVYTEGAWAPIAAIASGLHQVQSAISYLF